MRRSLIIGMSVAATAAVALPALVMAQDFPPPPPATYYGTVGGGATVGQGVIAVVSDGTSSQTCGDGAVIQNNGSLVYVIDVIQDGQKTGCGKAGRTIKFYFTPAGGNPGRLSNESATWTEPGAPKLQNLTLGATLNLRGRAPSVAKDGIW